ncbi:MAG: adenylosuccinate lyase [bacterium]|nr:adenylosuccinate lyase [bacterium]
MTESENSRNFQLTAVSSVDGRYRVYGDIISGSISEFALMKNRIAVECEYVLALSETAGIGLRKFTAGEKKTLRGISENFTLDDARIVKKIEQDGYEGIPATNHDVKAIEYYIKSKVKGTSLQDVGEWIHFALTSEDVDNIAYALMLRGTLENALLPALSLLQKGITDLASEHAATPMLARTHGQPASPTTFGKEMRVFEARVSRQIEQLKARTILVKFSGATGNYNAHSAAVPDVDWQEFSKTFIERFNSPRSDLGIRLELNETTTQIEPHDTYAELFDNVRRINTILIGFSQDIWRYVSDGWLTQKPKEGEVGSSAMPHKVNPIDFENAEGNLGVANALFEHFSRKLPISRLQRDLSDSTVKRTFGLAFGHSYIGYRALTKGLGKLRVNEGAMLEDLQAHPEVIAEAIQTVLRKEGVAVPYEKLKELTRGRKVTIEDFAKFIEGLSVDEKVKKHLKALRPENYIGLAEKIAKAA